MRTVHLDQYTDDHAEAIVEALDAAGIAHWEKTSGRFTRIFFAGDWGTRIFVDADRVDEAREIADRIVAG
ncbi:MAG: hypothetical protein ACRDUY_16725 [Nitriliruptorales bacterium]